ncbi:MAG: hypothetical protein H5T78_13310 [Nocardia sp.]|nr:hypothetical protein [Nocardia sp.]
MTYEDYKSKVIAAQEQWNTERSKIYDRQASGNYSTIFGTDTQPPHITTPDNYDAMTLDQMQAAVAAMKPQQVDDAVTAWANIGMNLMGTFYQFNQEFARTVTGGWSGSASSAAVTAVNDYATQSIPLSQAATAISLKLSEMRTGIEQTQALMPGLTERANVTGKSLPADGVMKVDDHNREEATEEARRILRSVYSQVAGQTDVGVPFLPTAPTIAGGDPGSNGGTNTGGSQGGSNGGASAADPSSGTPSTGTPSTGTPDDGTTTGEPSSDPAATTPQSTEAASTTPQSSTATPQSSTPTTATPTAGTPAAATPGVGTPSASGPGGGGTGGRGGSTGGGAGGRGGSAGSPATPGKTTPGSPAAAAAAAAGTCAGTAAGSGRGAAGMGGMGAPGARGGSDEERTKGIPDYLVTQENGDLLLGTNGIRTVPPVIGGEDGSAPS